MPKPPPRYSITQYLQLVILAALVATHGVMYLAFKNALSHHIPAYDTILIFIIIAVVSWWAGRAIGKKIERSLSETVKTVESILSKIS